MEAGESVPQAILPTPPSSNECVFRQTPSHLIPMRLPRKHDRPGNPPLRVAVFIALIAPVTLFIGGMVFTAQMVMSGLLDFASAFTFTMPLWLPWIAFGPMAVWLAFRFPLERTRLPRNLAIHLLFCGMICAINWNLMPSPEFTKLNPAIHLTDRSNNSHRNFIPSSKDRR